jgi:hypothetical protein
MTIQQMIRDPDLLKSYREWLQLPMTKMLQGMATKFARPVGLPNPTGETALFAQGHAVASTNFMRIIFELEDLAEEQRLMAKMKIDPEYGLRAILEDEGFPQYKRRSKKSEETEV